MDPPVKPAGDKTGLCRGKGPILAFVAAVLLATSTAAEPLDDVKWLHAGADRVAALTTAPPECLAMPEDEEAAFLVEAGRIAFRSHFLLGGPAARTGLSCQSCHVNGHDNPDFHLEGLSGAPGTLDATSHLFSKTRGDATFNPVPIPSLVDAGMRTRFGHAGTVPTLRAFIAGVIIDEFQGAPPPAALFEAVVAYVDALKSEACPAAETAPITLADDLDTIRRGALAASLALARRETALADFLMLALRGLLGRIHQRFDLPGLEEQAGQLVLLSGQLGLLRGLAREDVESARTGLAEWRLRLAAAGQDLAAREPGSLYNPRMLKAALSD